MTKSYIEAIHLAAARDAPMQAVGRVTAVAGQGLLGDRLLRDHS